MKSILHLKEDTEYQIPLMEKDNKEIGRAEVGAVGAKDQQNLEASKEEVKQEECIMRAISVSSMRSQIQ